jgi:hypothetical protein
MIMNANLINAGGVVLTLGGLIWGMANPQRAALNNAGEETTAAVVSLELETERIAASSKLAEIRYLSGLCHRWGSHAPISEGLTVTIPPGSYACDNAGLTAVVAPSGELTGLARTADQEAINLGLGGAK